MNEILHQELLALQQHLSTVHTASLQIDNVKNAAQQVITSVQQIQQQYETHLPILLDKLISNTQQQFESLETKNRAITIQTSQELLQVNTGIAQKYEMQYQQIQKYLADYEAITNLITLLNKNIQEIDFPQRFLQLEKTVEAIHEEVQKDIAALTEVKQHNENHLTAMQEAHQHYVSNFYQQTTTQFEIIATTYHTKTEKIIRDFTVLQQEAEVVANQQKQNFHLTLQHFEAQSHKAVIQINHNAETVLQKIGEIVSKMQEYFIAQHNDIQQFTSSYQGLVSYTQQVENKITDINFPQKLQNIAAQLEAIEHKQEEAQSTVLNYITKQFSEADNRIGLYKKQQESHYQLLENQNLLVQTQVEQTHRHLQQHTNELHKTQVEELRVQTELLQKQLVAQEKMLQYLLIAIVSVGVFSIVNFLWQAIIK